MRNALGEVTLSAVINSDSACVVIMPFVTECSELESSLLRYFSSSALLVSLWQAAALSMCSNAPCY